MMSGSYVVRVGVRCRYGKGGGAQGIGAASCESAVFLTSLVCNRSIDS